jgi:hypothetical protein
MGCIYIVAFLLTVSVQAVSAVLPPAQLTLDTAAPERDTALETVVRGQFRYIEVCRWPAGWTTETEGQEIRKYRVVLVGYIFGGCYPGVFTAIEREPLHGPPGQGGVYEARVSRQVRRNDVPHRPLASVSASQAICFQIKKSVKHAFTLVAAGSCGPAATILCLFSALHYGPLAAKTTGALVWELEKNEP